MKLAKIAKGLLFLSAALLLIGVVAWIGLMVWPVDEYTPEARNLVDESAYNLEEKVGWYSWDDGSHRMITWGAENGLILNRFDDIAQSDLKAVSSDTLMWIRKPEDIAVIVDRDSKGKLTGLSWVEANELHHAERLEHYQYDQQQVRFNNGDVQLNGLLMTPVGDGPYPAVVFVNGSGVSHHEVFWYLYQADFLAKQGLVVLLPDKRGCGKSVGQWHTAGMNDFAGDAVAALNLVRNLPGVDSNRVGLLGLSQGGMIAPLAAGLSPDVDYVIDVSGCATSFDFQIKHEIANDMRADGWPNFLVALAVPAFTRRAEKSRPIWWEKNGEFDPMDYWRNLSIPGLIVFGGEDEDQNVPVKRSLSRIDSALTANSDLSIDVKVFEGSGHAMGDPDTGWIRQEYLDFLARWIKTLPGARSND